MNLCKLTQTYLQIQIHLQFMSSHIEGVQPFATCNKLSAFTVYYSYHNLNFSLPKQLTLC